MQCARNGGSGALGADQPGHRNGPQQSRRGGARARPLALHARELLARAGTRSRPGRGEGARPGRLRSLRRPALPHLARPLRRRQRIRTGRLSPTCSRPTRARASASLRRCMRRAGRARPGIGESDRARYLAAIDGLAYGDDPADGVVRGRRFIHGRLGVAFEAPEGFSLENTSQAVLGSSADGNRRLLFDAATTPDGAEPGGGAAHHLERHDRAGQPRDRYRQWPAGRASPCRAGKEWSFRLSAIRIGGTTYRLILAARSGRRRPRGACSSARSPASGRSPRRRHGPCDRCGSQLVTAREGDTIETLAERAWSGDRPVERFLHPERLRPRRPRQSRRALQDRRRIGRAVFVLRHARRRRPRQALRGVDEAPEASDSAPRARCSFSRARFSIWRTRSFEMPRRSPEEFERHLLFLEPARAQDPQLALVQDVERLLEPAHAPLRIDRRR